MYTVPASFDRFRSNIEISGDNRTIASKRKDRIVSLLSNSFTILDAFPTGSIPRYTAVTGYADLDMMVVLHFGNHIKGKLPSEVLQAVRDALGEYSTNVRKNGQAVTLYYNTWPNVDIVPVARYVNDDGSISHYEVPNMKTETWIKSRPRKHNNDMTDKNKECGDMFKHIVKMIKWWNHQHGSYLQSYHIEVITLKTYTGLLSDYSWEICRFFDNAINLVSEQLWHEGGYADSYLNSTTRQEALTRLKTAKQKALTAWFWTYDDKDDHEKAIGIWRQIFGDKFPAYGS